MLTQALLAEVIDAQRENLDARDPGLMREALASLPSLSTHALIVSGIRRCGKSTLLNQLLKQVYPKALYLNFEDPRLYDFDRLDFKRLDQVIMESESKVLFFDELQIIAEWERYVRQKLDEGYRLVITGSNASLLSQELGTKLTGRHVSKELFPFSYHEYCAFTKQKTGEASLISYLNQGGFPEYVKTSADEILQQLFDDILIRDITVRYGLRDVKTLRRLAVYLVSNVGKFFTAGRLKSILEGVATSTILEYLSHLEAAWLFQLVPKFSYSQRKQLVNPRKVYAIDTGLIKAVSASFSKDEGRHLENLVYLHLRRRHREIYYFSEKGECDFIVFEKSTFKEAIQVCLHLSEDNLEREVEGLVEAMEFFKVKKGTIVTLKEKDRFDKGNIKIEVVPAHAFLL